VRVPQHHHKQQCRPTAPTWQKGHHGAYSTSSVSLSRAPPASFSTAALSRAATADASDHRSRSALRSSVVPSAFFTLPLCRPHSLAVAGRRKRGGAEVRWGESENQVGVKCALRQHQNQPRTDISKHAQQADTAILHTLSATLTGPAHEAR
jgi:hypothetical protein